ncbi:glutamate 5-kinase [Chloroflexota bacterium]
MKQETVLKKSPYCRLVVKFGTSLLTGGDNRLDPDIMRSLVAQVASLHGQGYEVIVISSGAIACGRHKLGLTKRIRGIPYKQVLAAVGQAKLMDEYDRLFGEYGITVGQALLTKTDLADRAGYLNARNTLLALLELGVICVVNENDIVAIDEIESAKFGDNDNLSAMVANLVDADMLLLLTDIAGLYTTDPSRQKNAELITEVKKIDRHIEGLAAGTHGNLGTGGMTTKVSAAKLATKCGVTVVIADGREPNIIPRLAGGEALGTRFMPSSTKRGSRQRWMMSGVCTMGRLTIDAGAAHALASQKRSLLSAGITGVTGKFTRGDIVEIYDEANTTIGCGITNYSSRELEAIKGADSRKIKSLIDVDYGSEVVHRNNLALQ